MNLRPQKNINQQIQKENSNLKIQLQLLEEEKKKLQY